jgi:threonine/homoserine/homoserine lactone efflux protein
MVGQLAAFLGISAIVIVTPGPDTALTIRNTLLGGRRAGIVTAMGVSSGQAAWTLATAAGVAALLAASEPAFVAVKVAGAAYLVWLGAQSLLGALRDHASKRSRAPRSNRLRSRAALRQGFLSNLGNPKMAAFFPSLLPQFAPQEHAFAALLGLGLVFCLMTLAWLTAYAFAVARAGDFLGRPAIRRLVDAVTGAVLVALGLRLATERR